MALDTPGHLMDHHFQGQPVLPAVEAMEALACVAKETYPHIRLDHLSHIHFEKFLFMEPGVDHLDAIAEFQTAEDGSLHATLLTRTKAPKAAFTRTKTHVRLTFEKRTSPPKSWRIDFTAALEGICTVVAPQKIYKDLVPFGPTFRNIRSPLVISPDGALAQIKTPPQQQHAPNGQGLLGSGYALDAAFHAACVWAQHYCGIVAFPVAMERRTIINPTGPAKHYVGRVIAKTIVDERLLFDLLLLDEDGLVCEVAEGIHMRDVSGGRLEPPGWIRHAGHHDPLELLKNACRDMAIIELDAVAGFAPQALTPLEMEKYHKMGPRRCKSFLAGRMALKRLHRRCMANDWATPANRIETVRQDSPLPFIDVTDSSKEHHCSLSHDRRFAVAAVASRAVGVDVEVISPKALNAGRIYMSTAEYNLVQQSSMDDTAAAVRIWSIKEAAAKATGINLADAWRQVQVTEVGENRSCITINGRTTTAQHATIDEHLFTLVFHL